MDWKIDRRNATCFGCQKDFNPAHELYSAIYEEEDGFQRKDFCEVCWEKGVPSPFSFWKIRGREAEQNPLSNLRSLKDVLKKLSGNRGGVRGKIAYLLALIFLRKKILLVRERRGDLFVLSFRGEEETISVFTEEIDQGEFKSLRETLEKVFALDEELLNELITVS